jgi:hypothetical protein
MRTSRTRAAKAMACPSGPVASRVAPHAFAHAAFSASRTPAAMRERNRITLYSRAMAQREGSWWSRGWGTVALLGFAIYLGAAVYEAAVIAPLWSAAPPASVSAWAALPIRPDSSALFQPLVAIIVVATSMAWMSGLTERGWRRWWLTVALACAAALAADVVLLLTPCERSLFGAAALADHDNAVLIALTGDWIRASAFRFAALIVGAWSTYRAQLAGMLGASTSTVLNEAASAASATPARSRRTREFAFGDELEEEVTLGEEAVNPRERWRTSLPRRHRTAKK